MLYIKILLIILSCVNICDRYYIYYFNIGINVNNYSYTHYPLEIYICTGVCLWGNQLLYNQSCYIVIVLEITNTYELQLI